MGYSQPLSAQTASTYPAVHQEANSTTPAATQEPESSSQPEKTGSSFSVGDAAWVLMRSISTAAECLNFVCRKVVALTSVCFGGFVGLFQYMHENYGNNAHENIENRTVQQVPAEENNRIDQQPPSQPSGEAPAPSSLKNPPMEEYVSKGANRWKKFVESSATPGSTYSWMHLLGMAISIISSILVLGVVGSAILHIPGLLLKAEPYITLDKPTHSPTRLLTQPASTLPVNQQEPKAPALDPAVDVQPQDNAANRLPPSQIEQQPAVVTSGESSQEVLDIQSTPSVEASNINLGSQPPIASDQDRSSPPQVPQNNSSTPSASTPPPP